MGIARPGADKVRLRRYGGLLRLLALGLLVALCLLSNGWPGQEGLLTGRVSMAVGHERWVLRSVQGSLVIGRGFDAVPGPANRDPQPAQVVPAWACDRFSYECGDARWFDPIAWRERRTLLPRPRFLSFRRAVGERTLLDLPGLLSPDPAARAAADAVYRAGVITVSFAGIRIPYWLLATVVAAWCVTPFGRAMLARKRRHDRIRRGLCPSCAYDVRGLARCPECGTPVRDAAPTNG